MTAGKAAHRTLSPDFERCLDTEVSATCILCDCEAIGYLRFHYMDHYFPELSDYHDITIGKVTTLHQECRIDKGINKNGRRNRS